MRGNFFIYLYLPVCGTEPFEKSSNNLVNIVSNFVFYLFLVKVHGILYCVKDGL